MYFKTASMIAEPLSVENKMKNIFGISSHGKTLINMTNASHEGNHVQKTKMVYCFQRITLRPIKKVNNVML
jgi:hypothetical protein